MRLWTYPTIERAEDKVQRRILKGSLQFPVNRIAG